MTIPRISFSAEKLKAFCFRPPHDLRNLARGARDGRATGVDAADIVPCTDGDRFPGELAELDIPGLGSGDSWLGSLPDVERRGKIFGMFLNDGDGGLGATGVFALVGDGCVGVTGVSLAVAAAFTAAALGVCMAGVGVTAGDACGAASGSSDGIGGM